MLPPSLKDGPPARLRLHYLDGVRGLAAFYVVLHHAYREVADVKDWLPEHWVKQTAWAYNGMIAVQIFIVLSGYCLMLPVTRSGSLQGGARGFISRRARRILPPYYAAIALSLAVIFLVPGMRLRQGLYADVDLPATGWGTLLSHLLLLQDLRPGWITKIDAPMWTIAQEWQIYFLFAILLLPLWRYAGIFSTVLVTFLFTFAVRHLPNDPLAYCAPQFLFLYSAGMLAATINFPGSSKWLVWSRDRIPWTSAFFVLAGIYLLTWVHNPDYRNINSIRLAVLVGALILCLLVPCTNASQSRHPGNLLLRFFEWQPVVLLGTFSYSLYLVHFPILNIATLMMRQRHFSGPLTLALEFVIGVPVALAFAYGFHLVAERPFMSGRPQTLRKAEVVASLETAP